MQKRFILFDHDGVLVDTEYWYYRATVDALEELGVPMSRQEYMTLMVHGYSKWAAAAEAGRSQVDIDAAKARRDAAYQQYLRSEDIAIAGVEEVLVRLQQTYRLAIVTTSKRVDFDLIHQHRNIVSKMEFVLANGDYAHSKPAPDPYLAALARFGATADEAVVVEDSQRGLRSAVAAGIDCVVVHNEFTQSQDFSAASARIQALAELPGAISQLGGRADAG